MRELLPRIEQLPLWPLISAPVFLALFIALCFWIFSQRRKGIYQAIARLPLDDLDPSKAAKEKH